MADLKTILHIDYPIVQAPMLGVTTPAMVAAVSNAGALGSLPLGGLSNDKARELIRQTKALTDRPFAVNLFAHAPAKEVNRVDIALMQEFLQDLCLEFNIPFEAQNPDNFQFHYYQELIDVLLEENVPIVSSTFGVLNEGITAAFKQKGVVLVGTATSVAEAKVLEQAGANIITVQGIEAGGHRGSFLLEDTIPQVGLISLLPQVADAVDLPLLAAGGIYDSRTVKSAFALGAAGIQVGSMFIVADESAASNAYKEAVLNAHDTSTVLTQAFSGRWARGIENEFMRRMDAKGIKIPYYTVQNQLMGSIRAYAQKNNLPDFVAMWAGQSAGKSGRAASRDITTKLISMLPLN